MKKFFYSVLAAATMLFATTSCSQEEEILGGSQSGDTQKVTFNVQLPSEDVTSRAIAGGYEVGKGQMANKLIWALYESTKTNEDPVQTGIGTKVQGQNAFTAKIDMVKGLEYKVLFFAYNENGTIFQIDAKDDLKSLEYKSSVVSNVEAYDAFAACHDHKVNDEAETTVTLYRPFAQINAATSNADLQRAEDLDATVVESDLILKNVPIQYNVLTGEVSNNKVVTYTKSAILQNKDTQKNEQLTVKEGNNDITYNYLNMVYVLAGDGTTTSSNTDATFNFYRSGDAKAVRTIDIPNLPIQRNWRTNVIGDLLTQTESFKIVIDENFGGDHNILEGEVVPVATPEELQEAVNNAEGPTVIKFTEDFGNVSRSTSTPSITIVQKEGTDLVIDGCGYAFNGTFYLEGMSRNNGSETLTFKNINFIHNDGSLYFIDANSTEEKKRYAHNVTVENCTFTGNNNGDVVGMRYRQCYNIKVRNVEGTNLHSLIWTTGGNNLIIDGAEVTGCKEGGISTSTTTNVEIKNSKVQTSTPYGYGVRFNSSDDSNDLNLKVSNCEFIADAPILLRQAKAKKYTLELTGNNVLTTSKEYQVIICNNEYKEGVTLEAPTGTYTITGADDYNVYPREIVVYDQAELQAALNIGKSVNIKLADNINGEVTVTEKLNVDIVIDGCGYEYDGQIKIKGNSEAPENSTLLIKDINFKTSTKEQVFIWSYDSKSTWRYAENVTVDNCTFTAEEEAINTAAGVKFIQAYNIKITNCTATKMHSLAQFQSIDSNVTVENVTINNSKGGISFGTTKNPTITNSTINVSGYGVRGDGDGRNCELVVKDTKITAEKPVIIRRVNNKAFNYSIDFEGNNALNANGTYQVVFTNGEDDEAYAAPTGTYTIEGADNYNVYPREVLVSTVDELKAATKKSGNIKIANNIEISDKWSFRIDGEFANEVIIDGNGYTISFVGEINNPNHNTAFRFLKDATIKNLTIDMSQAKGTKLRAISTQAGITVDNCKIIGNTTNGRRGIIFAEGATEFTNIKTLIKNSEFINWSRGITDNENGKDVKSVFIEGCTFTAAPVYVSAYENITFVNNIMKDGSNVNITSYTSAETAKVKATGNTLDGSMSGYNVIGGTSKKFDADNVEAQNGFVLNLK